MSNVKFFRLAAVCAATALSCNLAFAVDMTVTAAVVGTCRVITGPTLDFGTLNQVTALDLTPTAVNATYRCTKNTAPATFTVGASASPYTGSLSNGTDTIAYTVSWTAP